MSSTHIKIKKVHIADKDEDVHVFPFFEWYYGDSLKEVEFEAIPEASTPTPDYHVHSTEANLEVKELHDQASNSQMARWSTIIGNLRKTVETSPRKSQVKGLYLINTPFDFKFTQDSTRLQKAADILIDSVLQNLDNVEIEGVNFDIKKVSDQTNQVYFGGMGKVGAIDSARTIHQNIQKQLKTANNQLPFEFKSHKPKSKIVLIVNKYQLIFWDWDIYTAFSYLYSDLLTYANIDEIWFQSETKKGFIYKLLFKKKFFEDFEKGRVDVADPHSADLFSNWFSPLEKMGDEKKEKLFKLLKEFLKFKKPSELFREGAREEMVMFGTWLTDQGRFDDALWIIDKFIDDPDPPIPNQYKGKKEHNYHKQVIKGEDPSIITTVLGHLAWTIQKLTVQKEYIVPALDRAIQLLKHENYYVKLQGTVPLVEISRRRQWLKEYDKINGTHKFSTFHKTTFSLLKDLSKYKALAEALINLFYWYQDLNTEDALEVVNKLKQSSEAAPILIWFGLFRKRHFPLIPFKFAKLEKALRDVIVGSEKEYGDLQNNILWNFWKILQDNPEEFDILIPYIDLYLSQPYKKSSYRTIELITEDWLEKRPEVIIPWFEKAISNTYDYIKRNPNQSSMIWLSPEQEITYLAKKKPDKLIKMVEILKNLWKEGGYIGSPKEIFESYKDIANSTLKQKIRDQYKIWHKELKSLNSTVQEVDWSL